MKGLTARDIIAIEIYNRSNPNTSKQNLYLLSRYFDISIDTIMDVDVKQIHLMTAEFQQYMKEIDENNKKLSDEAKNGFLEPPSDFGEEDDGPINDRFGILDL